jgi:hypothetical protein
LVLALELALKREADSAADIDVGGIAHFDRGRCGPAFGIIARKKSPRKMLCPRGAKDTSLFRERLDAWPSKSAVIYAARFETRRTTAIRQGSRHLTARNTTPIALTTPSTCISKRTVHIHANGKALRGPQERPASVSFPDADPSTWIGISFPHSPRASTLVVAHKAARIWHLPICVKGGFSRSGEIP